MRCLPSHLSQHSTPVEDGLDVVVEEEVPLSSLQVLEESSELLLPEASSVIPGSEVAYDEEENDLC